MKKGAAVRSLKVDHLNVEVYESTGAMGKAAALSAAERLCQPAKQNETIAVIFATGASPMPIPDFAIQQGGWLSYG